MINPNFQIFKGKDSQFYYRLRATNGQIILASKGSAAKGSYYSGYDC